MKFVIGNKTVKPDILEFKLASKNLRCKNYIKGYANWNNEDISKLKDVSIVFEDSMDIMVLIDRLEFFKRCIENKIGKETSYGK